MMENSFNDRHISFQQSIQFVYCTPSNRDDILQESRRSRNFRLGLQELCYSLQMFVKGWISGWVTMTVAVKAVGNKKLMMMINNLIRRLKKVEREYPTTSIRWIKRIQQEKGSQAKKTQHWRTFGVKQIAKDLNVNHVLGQIIAGHGRWLMVVVPSLIGEIWFSSLRLVGISRILWLLLLGN